MTATPNVSITAASPTVFLGTTQTLDVTFQNVADPSQANATGYAPFVVLDLDSLGVSPSPDGVSFAGATYLGAAVTAIQGSYDSAGHFSVPNTKDASGNPLVLTGTPGDQAVYLALPFGSFAAGQTPADIQVSVNVAATAQTGAALPISAVGGFGYGTQATGNTAANPTIISAASTTALTPSVLTVAKTYLGPEQETATGPAYPEAWKVTGDVAKGATVSNLKLSDPLPNGVVATRFTVSDGTTSWNYTVDPTTGALTAAAGNPAGAPAITTTPATATGSFISFDPATNAVQANFATVVGSSVTPEQNAATAPSITTTFYVGQNDNITNTTTPVLDPTAPGPVPLVNTATASATYASPTHGTEIATATLPPPGDNTIDAKPIAIQKSVVDTTSAIAQPGDHLVYTLNGQVSNYFDADNIVVTDSLGDGQSFDALRTPTLVAVENGHTIDSVALSPADYTVTRSATTGISTLTFDVSRQLLLDGQAGDLDGGAAADDATASPAAATFQIVYAGTIDPAYIATGAGAKPSVDSKVEQGDSILNNVVVNANLVTDGSPISDTSATTVTLPTGVVGKTVYAINGTLVPAGTVPTIKAGDDVTYSLTYTLPETRADAVTLKDFLPQPVFDIADPNGATAGSYSFSAAGGIPADGVITYGPLNTLPATAHLGAPAVSVDDATNELLLNFGSIDAAPNYAGSTINVLFTTKVIDAPFANDLLLTNQVTGDETNSFGAVTQTNAIAQIELVQPVLTVEKGVVGISDPTARIVGSHSFSSTPGTAGVAFTGTIDSANLNLNAHATGAVGGDIVRFAVAVENTGGTSAYGVLLHDVLPTGYVVPASGLNLEVTDGTGQALSYIAVGGGLFDPNGGIELVDPSTTQGALAADSASSGKNIVVLTYDEQLSPTIALPQDKLVNTAVVTSFSAVSGGANDALGANAGTLSAATYVTTAAPSTVKTVIATSESATAADRSSLKIGETVTYSVTTTLSEGTLQNLTLNDLLPNGSGGDLTFLSGSVTSVGSSISNSDGVVAGTQLVGNAAGTSASVALGNVTVAPGGTPGTDSVTYTVTAAYLGSDANNKGGQTLTNTADTTATNPNSPGQITTSGIATASVTSRAPELALTKQVEDLTHPTGYTASLSAQGGDEVQYDIHLVNNDADGNGQAAFNAEIKDLLASFGTDAQGHPNVVLEAGSVTATGGATVVTGNAAGDTTIDVTDSMLAAGGSIDVVFKAKLAPDAVFNTSLPNTASYTANTLPSTDPNVAATGYDRVLTGNASADIKVTDPSATKTLSASTDANIPLPDLAPGETGSFTITVAVPEGTSPDLRIQDLLPSGLTYAGNARVVSVAGAITTGTPTVSTTAGGATYDFGAVTAGSGGGTITLALDATAAIDAGLVNGQTLTNTVDTFSGGTLVNTSTAAATVVLADLTLTKTETQPAGAHPYAGQEVDYTVTIGDAADDTAPAYNVVLKDVLPADATLIAGSIHSSLGTAVLNGNEIDISIPALKQGQTVSLTYGETLKDSVTPGQTVINTATLDYQTQASGGQAQPEKTASAALPIVMTPSIVKTTLSGNDAFLTLPNARVGETVTYRLDATLQPGTQSLVIDDALPTGLSFVAGQVVSVGAGISGATLNPAATLSGNDVVFNFGTVTDTGSGVNAGPAHVVVDVTAIVAAGATGVQTDTGTVTISGPGGIGRLTASAPDTTTIVPPAPGSLSGTVFTDNNDDGIENGADTGLAGVTVKLIGANGLPTGATTVTASNGSYSFANLAPGSYSVQVVAPATDGFSPQQSTTSATTSIVGATGATAAVAVTEGTDTPNQNAGVYVPVAVSGHVFVDSSGDGVQQPSEPNIAGVQVTLLDGAGNSIAGETATTNANGAYGFTGLKPGTYEVAFTAPAADPKFAPVGGPASPVDSIAYPLTGITPAVTLTSGQAAINQNAGVYAPASLSGHVFTDLNDDGVQTAPTDTNLAGVTVQLLDALGNPIAGSTATTAADGSYRFANLTAGTYAVAVMAPSGDSFSPVGGNANPALDSIVNAGGRTAPVTLAPGQDKLDQNAGLLPPQPALSITKTTPTVTGQAGDVVTYTIEVAENADTVTAYNVDIADLIPAGETLIAGSETASRGTVSESGGGFSLAVGTLAALDAPVTVTYQARLTDTVVNGQAITNTGSLTYDSAPAGGVVYTATAPDTVHTAIVDTLAKTLVTTSQNGGDLVIPGETVTFDLTATLGGGTQHLVLTDALPNYLTGVSATVLSEGNVTGASLATGAVVTPVGNTLSVDFGTVVNPGASRTAPGDQVVVRVTAQVAANTPFSTIVTNTGTLTATTPAGAPQQVTTATAPVDVVQPGVISAYVFLDGQCDGTYHVGDPGVAGVTVRLLDLDGNPTGAVTTTDSHGGYSFANLIPGQYEVQVAAPTGTSFSHTEHASGNALVDNDVNVTTGVSDLLTVTAGGTNQGANAGLIFNGYFSGTTPIVLAGGQTYDGNGGNGVIVGPGGDLVHTGSGGNNLVILGGLDGGNLVEAGGGTGTDIVTSCGPLNAQTQNASNGFLFAGGTGMSTLQGGQGNTYLQGGRGNDLITAGSGVNVLIGGGDTGTVQQVNGQVTGYTQGDELRTGGISTTVLYQKGDGVETIDNGFRIQDHLEISGYASGTMETVNGQRALYLGGNDLIIFNGGTDFGSNGISYDANPVATAQESVVFGANGLPTIVPASGAIVSAAPIPATVIPAVTPVMPIPATVPVSSTPATVPAMSQPVVPTPIATPAATIAVTLGGWNQSYVDADENHLVSGSQGSATISLGQGNNVVTASGWNNLISAGNGNNTISAGDGSETVTLGNGVNSVQSGGWNNTITVGSGQNAIVAGSGNETVNLAAGNDVVTLSGWSNLITSNGGHAVVSGGAGNTYQIDAVGSAGGVDVTDFGTAANDVLDLSKLLANSSWNHQASSISNFLRVADTGGNTVVSFDASGSGAGFSVVATLGGSNFASLTDLQNHAAIRLG